MKTFHKTTLALAAAVALFVSVGASSAQAQNLPRFGFVYTHLWYNGLRVDSVSYGSLADQLGIQAGDVITHVNGQPLLDYGDYDRYLQEAVTYRGGYVQLTIRTRRGNCRTVSWNFGCSYGPQQYGCPYGPQNGGSGT